MYTEEDLKGLSIEELINLVNQITEERNLYRDKCQKLLKEKNVQERRTIEETAREMPNLPKWWTK